MGVEQRTLTRLILGLPPFLLGVKPICSFATSHWIVRRLNLYYSIEFSQPLPLGWYLAFRLMRIPSWVPSISPFNKSTHICVASFVAILWRSPVSPTYTYHFVTWCSAGQTSSRFGRSQRPPTWHWTGMGWRTTSPPTCWFAPSHCPRTGSASPSNREPWTAPGRRRTHHPSVYLSGADTPCKWRPHYGDAVAPIHPPPLPPPPFALSEGHNPPPSRPPSVFATRNRPRPWHAHPRAWKFRGSVQNRWCWGCCTPTAPYLAWVPARRPVGDSREAIKTARGEQRHRKCQRQWRGHFGHETTVLQKQNTTINQLTSPGWAHPRG